MAGKKGEEPLGMAPRLRAQGNKGPGPGKGGLLGGIGEQPFGGPKGPRWDPRTQSGWSPKGARGSKGHGQPVGGPKFRDGGAK